MPEVLKTFDFPPRGRPARDWSEFTDGKIRRLVAGVDFTSKPATVRSAAAKAAAKAGMGVKSAFDGEDVIIQFVAKADKAAPAPAAAARKRAK